MRILALPLLLLALVACSDPAEKAKEANMELKDDSLRAEIRAAQVRLDSLRKEGVQLRKTLDSLNIPQH